MPDRRPIDALRSRLAAEMGSEQVFRAPVWGNPHAMTEALRLLKRDLSEAEPSELSPDQVQASLRRFGATQQVQNFTELKYVCYGISVPVGDEQWRVIDDGPLFKRLLTLVDEQEAKPKQYRRCYQGLLNGYFNFTHSDAAAPSEVNWKTLRGFLGSKLEPIAHTASRRGVVPTWLQTLASHRNLLTDDPCSRYANELVGGNTSELKELCMGLGIASNSWVWDEALMAYVHAVCAGKDGAFQNGLSGVLQLVNGRSDLKLPHTLAKRATAMAVVRYSHCSETPEHASLRDTCVSWIGNPWLKRVAWDAEVGHEPARKMVEGWVKRRLIKDFFQLLAEDGAADLRRLNYWLKWEPEITQMWFVLGSDARRNKSASFVKLRKSMEGQERTLIDNNDRNNAFVMKIGPLLVIEFGVTGNACYVFAAADFRTNLDAPTFSIGDLKQRLSAKRLSHIANWEHRFDYELKSMLQSVPASKGDLRGAGNHKSGVQQQSAGRGFAAEHYQQEAASWKVAQTAKPGASPTSTRTENSQMQARSLSDSDIEAICNLCTQHGIDWEDNRRRNGALWILIPDPQKHPTFAKRLEAHGFRFKQGTGFWLKGEG